MNQLPLETLQKIFILLPQPQKLKCMRVCRSWAKVIKDTCLFHTVLITTHKNLDKLIRILDRTPSNRTQVKRLISCIGYEKINLVQSFFNYFPNLKFFYNYGHVHINIKEISENWMNNRLEFLYDSPLGTISHHLLFSSVCSHLTILDLSVPQLYSPVFINAPNLTHLSLRGYRFKYDEVEQFDQVFPLLKTVKFDLIGPLDRDTPKKIKPNTRITCVHFKVERIRMTHQSILLHYVEKKYTNLAALVYDSGVPSDGLSKEYEIKNNCELHRALTSLIVAQGPQLKKLKVLCNRFVFSRLVNSSMPFQLNELNLDMTLTFSGSLHIKHTLLKSPFRQLCALTVHFLTTSNFEWLESLNNLNIFKIKCPRVQLLRLDSVMQHASEALKTLVIKGCSVGVEQDECDFSTSEKPTLDQDNYSVKTITIYPLRKIKMTNVKISKNVDKFISRSCPELKSLTIYNCSLHNIEVPLFRLPNIHLWHFSITKSYPSREKNWNYIKVHTNKESRFYHIGYSQYNRHLIRLFGFHNHPVSESSPVSTSGHLSGTGIWNFTFASVEHVGISDEPK